MPVKLWLAPQVELCGITRFIPTKKQVNWVDAPSDPFDPERLIEYAGRTCYQSFDNKSGRSNRAYIENLLNQGHNSVFEHVTLNFDIEGVSRALTHELITHRVGIAKSQLSSRYVEHFEAVVPPLILDDDREMVEFEHSMNLYQDLYYSAINRLKAKGHTGKKLREAAAYYLPNAAETKLVWSANVSALRYITRLRTGSGANAEIRRLGFMLLEIAKAEVPNSFADYTLLEETVG